MTDTLDLQLNPELDARTYAEIYARDGLVQIPNILPPDVAEAIQAMLASQVQWRLVFPSPDDASRASYGNVVSLTQQDMQSLGQAGVRDLLERVLARARENYGFLYSAYPMVWAYTAGEDPGHPIHRLTEFLNSETFLEFGRQVIGADQITKADALATLYARGSFLTRHTD